MFTAQKTFPDELQVVALWTYNNTACQEAFAASFGGVIYGDYISFYLNDGVMCAANHTSGGLDACFVRKTFVFTPYTDTQTDRERERENLDIFLLKHGAVQALC